MMLNKRALSRYLATPLLWAALATPSAATSVEPVIVNLSASGRQMSQIVAVKNDFANPLPVEIRVETAEPRDDGLHSTGKPSDDLLVFPPQALVLSGKTQSFRVQYVGDPALASSKHYIITVAQLPVKLPQRETAVQVLYDFQVIVSVGVPGAKSAVRVAGTELYKDADGKPRLALRLSNASSTYGYLSNGSLRIVQRDASGKEVYRKVMGPVEIEQTIGIGLVAAGQNRRMLTPLVMPVWGGTVDASFTPGRG